MFVEYIVTKSMLFMIYLVTNWGITSAASPFDGLSEIVATLP